MHIWVFLSVLGRNDKQEWKVSLLELQAENKTILERISQIEKSNKSQFDEKNPVSNSLEDEIAELKQRVQESEDRMTNTFYQIDHRLRTMTPNIIKENNVKFLDPARDILLPVRSREKVDLWKKSQRLFATLLRMVVKVEFGALGGSQYFAA